MFIIHIIKIFNMSQNINSKTIILAIALSLSFSIGSIGVYHYLFAKNYNPKDIRWDSPDFSSKELEPIYIPTTSNILNITAFNANDCRAGDTISITVNRDYRIYFPNILSFASKDGNDEFFFKSFNNIIQTIEVFEVYDRYGNIVERAESVNPDYIWQGKLSSKPILPGVYPFIVKLILINGEIINRSGTITIVD